MMGKHDPDQLTLEAEIKILKEQNKLLAKSLSDCNLAQKKLKEQNKHLAKSLSESSQKCRQISEERDQFHKELQESTILNNRYSYLVKHMSGLSKVLIRRLCDMSSDTEMMVRCLAEAENLQTIVNESKSTRVLSSFLHTPCRAVTTSSNESDDPHGNPDVSYETVSLSEADISSFVCQTGSLDGLPAVRKMTVTDQSDGDVNQEEHNETENGPISLQNNTGPCLGTLAEESDVADYMNDNEMISGAVKTVQTLLSHLSGEPIREEEPSRMSAEEVTSSQNPEPQDESYDPLEGPSALLDRVSNRKQSESGSRSPSFEQSEELVERRTLRTRRCVSYKEPPLNRKLRR